MAGYGYGPPPPPPPLAARHPPYAQSHASYPHHGPPRGGTSGGRGRGGHHGRGRGGYNAASTPQLPYEYAAQPYPPHGSPPYSAAHPSAVAFSPHPQQWAPEHGHVPHAPNVHPHAPVPISSSNYHPNYAPQAYPSAPYAQQPSYGSPQQYGNPYQVSPQPPAPQHWTYHGSPPQGHFANGRGRGGYNDRSGSKPHGVGPAHRGYEHEAVAQVSGSSGQPYHHEPRPPHYPPAQYPYPGPPPPPPAPVHQEGYHGQYQRRGRGGGHRDGGRGRGGYHKNINHNHHGGDGARQQQRQGSMTDKIKMESPSVGRKKKRKTNTLGLTPGMDSESEDDEGEEKALFDLIGCETLQITDIAGFLDERRKNYPTKARIEAKKAAELARRDEDKASSLEKQADRLWRQLRKVESSIKRKREQGDEGDEMRDSSEGESDDEKPEVMSSRPDDAEPPPPAPKADITGHCKYYSTGGTCGKKGKCRFVHDPEAREAAMKEREANDGRMTIQQRLTLNDKEQEDLTVLQSIQYLREKGVMKSAPVSHANHNRAVEAKDQHRSIDVDIEDPRPAPTSSLLPAPPASLPDPPVKRGAGSARRNPPPSVIPTANSVSSQVLEHYQGWLLQPYGSTNGKQSMSDDLP